MSGPALLDVNVLLALFDPAHIHHDIAHDWFSEEGEQAWATCPLTENGLVRIVSNPKYPSHTPATTAIELLRRFCSADRHVFWPDDVSLRELGFESGKPLRWKQATDVYLLGLAKHHGGHLVTFDKSIPLSVLKGTTREHLVVLAPV